MGLTPTFAHLDSTSFQVDGRYNSHEEPDEHVIHMTRGYSRDHRPDLNQVMLDLIVEHQAGIPVLMKPLSGNTSDVRDFGQVVTEHMRQLQTTYGTTYLVADSALYSEENLQQLAVTGTTWITRVPATLTEAQTALEHAIPETMLPLRDGYRDQAHTVTYGSVPQRWVLIYSEHRRPQAQRHGRSNTGSSRARPKARRFSSCATRPLPVKPMPSKRLPPLRTVCLPPPSTSTTFAQHRAIAGGAARGKAPNPTTWSTRSTGHWPRRSLPVSPLSPSTVVSSWRPTNWTTVLLPPQELLDGYKGQKHVEHGFRFLKDPRFLAASLYLKKPERIMALLMVMTVCLLVYAALEYRIRQGLINFQATFPNQKGQPIQNPTARWVFQYFSGIHVLRIPGEGAFVLNVTDQHRQLLQRLGRSYEAFYS